MKITLLHNDPDFQKLVKDTLSLDHRLTILEKSNPETTLNITETQSDLYILRRKLLKDLAGTLVAYIKEFNPTAKVFIVSDGDNDDEALEMLSLGADMVFNGCEIAGVLTDSGLTA